MVDTLAETKRKGAKLKPEGVWELKVLVVVDKCTYLNDETHSD